MHEKKERGNVKKHRSTEYGMILNIEAKSIPYVISCNSNVWNWEKYFRTFGIVTMH